MALQDDCDDEDWGNWGNNNANTIVEQNPVKDEDLTSWQKSDNNDLESTDKENKWDNDSKPSRSKWDEDSKPTGSKWDDDSKPSRGKWDDDPKPSRGKWGDDSKPSRSKWDDNQDNNNDRRGGHSDDRRDNRPNNRYDDRKNDRDFGDNDRRNDRNNDRDNDRRNYNNNDKRDYKDQNNERRNFNDRAYDKPDFNDRGNDRRTYNDRDNERNDYNDKRSDRRTYNDRDNERNDYNDKKNDRRTYNDRDSERNDFNDKKNDRRTYNDRDNERNDRDSSNRDFNDKGGERRNFNERDYEGRGNNDRDQGRRTYNDRDNENRDYNKGNDRRTYNDRDNERQNFGDRDDSRNNYNDRTNDRRNHDDFERNNNRNNDRNGYKNRDDDDLSESFQNKTNLNDNNIRTFNKGNRDGDNNEEPPIVKRATYIPNDDEQDYELHVNSGINFDNYEKIPVEVTGDAVPELINKFSDFAMPEFLMKNIESMKYTKLTPVQKYAIPIIQADRDLMACAQTGSGKTAAFLLPIIVSLHNSIVETETTNSQVAFPKALIMAPTRELCRQIFTAARQLCLGSELKCAYIYGGIEMNKSRRNLQASGCDILVATPGRLIHFLELVWVSLRHLRYFVLDEGDRMLDKDGFYESVNKISEEANFTGEDRKIQISMFSATFPGEIQDLAKNILKNYLFLAVGMVGSANCDVKQEIIKADQKEKMNLAIDYIKNIPNEKTLIFVQSKRMADFFGIKLGYLGYKATTIHGDREQEQREMALNDFKSGRVNFMVATNVAARGLDIPMVDTVINIDMPDDIDTYVHRIGRTGRCGNVGRAVSFFDENNDSALAAPLIKRLQEANQECPDWLSSMSDNTGYRKQSSFAKDNRRDMKVSKFVDIPADNFMKGSNADYDDDEQSEWLKD